MYPFLPTLADCFFAAEEFGPVCMALTIFEKELLKPRNRSYSRAEILDVFSLILNAEHRYFPYHDLVMKLGETKVDEMIERNLLHYRPVSGFRDTFSRDIMPFPGVGIVTASGVPALLAMRILLDRFAGSRNEVLISTS